MDEFASHQEIRQAVRKLRSELLADIRHAQADLQSQVGNLGSEFWKFAEGWTSAREMYEAIEQQRRDVAHEIADMSKTLRLLEQKVSWLERHAVASGVAEMCDLDNVPPDLVHLGAKAARGHLLAAKLLDRDVRRELQGDINRHVTWHARRDQQRAEALRLSATLAAADRSHRAHRQAATMFPEARAALVRLEVQRDDLRGRAEQARERLAADDALRRAGSAEIAAGDKAWQALCERLRPQLVDAVAAGAMFPPWFANSLGPAPPRDGAARWFDVATNVWAYRITYHVTTRLSALGEPPADGVTPGRRVWHDRLRADLDALAVGG